MREKFKIVIENYKEDSKILRQIHQNKVFFYKNLSTCHTVITIIISAFLSLLGFRGLDSIKTILGITEEQDIIRLENIFSVSIFIFFILAILKLVFRFEEKANTHMKAVSHLSGFIRDLKDYLLMDDYDNSEIKSINKEIRERYKMITETLPPCSDSDHKKAKDDYLAKKKEKGQ